MSVISVVWSGLDTLVNAIQAIAQRTPPNISTIYAEVGSEAKDLMDSLTPVRTGKLKAGNTLDLTDTSATLSNDVDYAMFVNYGTRHMAAQPFFDPAVEYLDQQLQQRLPSAFGERV